MSNTSSNVPTALFLFAHQDDEFGVFQAILDEQRQAHRVCCAYLTDGGISPVRRNLESLSVLREFGVTTQDVCFAGQTLSIPDGGLHEHLQTAADWIDSWLASFPGVTTVYIPAWEGGHPDHDVLHALAVHLAQERGMLTQLRQFPLYNGYRCIGPFFNVLTSLPMNGITEKTSIHWKSRLHFLYYCLCYPSQAKSWLGLFPLVLLNYLFHGKQLLQPVCVERICQRPHNKTLYYEKRGFSTWAKITAQLSALKLARQSSQNLPQIRKCT